MYIVQSVKAAHNNGIRCKRLQSLLSNLGLDGIEPSIFSKDHQIPFNKCT